MGSPRYPAAGARMGPHLRWLKRARWSAGITHLSPRTSVDGGRNAGSPRNGDARARVGPHLRWLEVAWRNAGIAHTVRQNVG